MFAGLWDDIKSGAVKTVDAATAEIKTKIIEFAKAKEKAEANYALLLAQNNYRIANKVYFKSEAERQKFQALLDEGRAAVNTARTVRNGLLVAFKAVNADARDYGLGFVQFIIPVAVAVGIYESVKTLNAFIGNSSSAVKADTLIAQGVPPADAAKLQIEADKAKADANKTTFDRIMDNLPLLGGGALALMVLPKVVEMLPKPKQARA